MSVVVITPRKKSVRTGAARSVGKTLYLHTVDDSVQYIGSLGEKHGKKETQAVAGTNSLNSSHGILGFSSTQRREPGNQENQGSQDTQNGNQRKETIVRAHQSGLLISSFVECQRRVLNIFNLGRGWKCPVAAAP